MGQVVEKVLFNGAADPEERAFTPMLGLLDQPVRTIDGEQKVLRDLTNGYKLTIIVNVASK